MSCAAATEELPVERRLLASTAFSTRSSRAVPPATLPLPASILGRVARPIRTRRKTIGSRRRVLGAGAQALLTLVYLRKGERLRDLAAGFGISVATRPCSR